MPPPSTCTYLKAECPADEIIPTRRIISSMQLSNFHGHADILLYPGLQLLHNTNILTMEPRLNTGTCIHDSLRLLLWSHFDGNILYTNKNKSIYRQQGSAELSSVNGNFGNWFWFSPCSGWLVTGPGPRRLITAAKRQNPIQNRKHEANPHTQPRENNFQ